MAGGKREAILQAAADLFRSEGVHAASMAKIREASGASAGSIYHHFDSKNEIVMAVAEQALVEPLRDLTEKYAGAQLSPGEMFRLIVDAVASGRLEPALIVQLWAASAHDDELRKLLRDQVLDLRRGLFALVRLWLDAKGLDPSRAETIARVTVGQAMGLLTQRTLDPDFDHDLYVGEAVRLLEGLAHD